MGSNAPFVIEDDESAAKALVITGPWTREAEETLLRDRPDVLVLNYARGFEPDLERGELEFLDARFPVRRLRLLDRGVLDISPIYRLRDSLEELSIQAAPQAELDLGELPGLRRVAGDWSLIGPSLGALNHLQRVGTWRFDELDFSAFTAHTNLVCLTVKDARRLESLDGIASCDALRYLEIRSARQLADISSLRDLGPSIETLRLEKCPRIGSLDALTAAIHLRFLEIGDCGDLPSASELRGFKELETLSAWGSTRFVDGDLSTIVDLPSLSELRMRNRRHYRPAVSEIPSAVF